MMSPPFFRRLPLDSSVERLSRGRLRHKLLILWLGSILGTLLLVGAVTTWFIDDFRRREAHREITSGMGQFQHEMDGIKAALSRQAELIAGHGPVLAALNMIHRYQDEADYLPLVFDPEKRAQGAQLSERVRSADLAFAVLYDGRGTMAAFAAAGDPPIIGHHSVTGGAQVTLLQSQGQWAVAPPPSFLAGMRRLGDLSGSGPVTRNAGGRVLIEIVAPLIRTIPNEGSITVGYVHIGKVIGDDALDKLSSRTALKFGLALDGRSTGPLKGLAPELFGVIPELTDTGGECRCAWAEVDDMSAGAGRLILDDGASAVVMAAASTSDASALAEFYRKSSAVVILGLALLVAPVGLLVLNQMILLPLSRLLDGVEALRLGRRIELRSRFRDDEFGTLAANFDGMADEIAEREDELRRSVDQLAQSRSELERFTTIAAHDLQEPLRLVTSYTQLLKRRYGDRLGPDADEFIGYAVQGAERMKILIQNVLDYSHVEDEAPFEAVDLNALAAETVQTLQPSISESAAEITVDPLPTVRGNARQLGQVFNHLLSNALKFRRGAPKIAILARRDRDGWVIEVQDNGIGIEAEYLPQLFTLFRRLHTQQEYPGSGLGLAIARRIVERHRGHIWAQSRPGEGTTISFSLPG